MCYEALLSLLTSHLHLLKYGHFIDKILQQEPFHAVKNSSTCWQSFISGLQRVLWLLLRFITLGMPLISI